MLDEDHIKAAKESLEKLRGWTNELSRWSFLSIEKKTVSDEQGYVCVAGLNQATQFKDPDKLLLFSYNGSTPKNGRATGADFKGDELSKKWLEFLLGENSPFPEAASHVYNKDDIDWINEEGGLIFDESYLTQGSGQLRGLLISTRYCQEFNGRCVNWSLMVDSLGIDPLIAWIISLHWTFAHGWIIDSQKCPDHAVFYEPPGLYLPNLAKRSFPFDTALFDGRLGYCTNALYEKAGRVWDMYSDSYSYTESERNKALNFGVGIGDNAKQAEEKILNGLKELEGKENENG